MCTNVGELFIYVSNCTSQNHKYSGSKYKSSSVPISFFRKEPLNPESRLFQSCIDCRLYQRKIDKRYVRKHKDIAEKTRDFAFRYCSAKTHSNTSAFPRNKVPRALFLKEPGNRKSELLNSCIDCRKFTASMKLKNMHLKKRDSEKTGKFFCTNCYHEKELTEKGKNSDGSASKLCKICKELDAKRKTNIRKWYNEVKVEMILENSCSCQKCNCVYLQTNDPMKCLKIPIINGGIEYKGFLYKIGDFLIKYKHKLELSIVQLDHLPENDQRKRKMLEPTEPYIKKKNIVSKLCSKSQMKLEALKCQNLCLECHVKETISREIGNRIISRAEKVKLSYVATLKEKGCSLCMFKDDSLPRFFHLDHINPKNKIANVSKMVKDGAYSLQDVTDECRKCRVLCGHCHIFHTKQQRKDGII